MPQSFNINQNIYRQVLTSTLAPNTRIAYDKSWRQFTDYCALRKITPLPAMPEAVGHFLVEKATNPSPLSGKIPSMGTITLYRSAINRMHIDSGYTSPTNNPEIMNALKGLKRIRGVACRRVRALREHHIKAMLGECGNTPIGLRNAAIIAIGFAGALRRSEICGLTVDDIEIMEPLGKQQPRRMFLHIRRSKTDQEGRGQKIGIPEGTLLRPIKRLQDWLRVSGISQGPVFQTMRRGGALRGFPMHHSDVPRLVKYYAAKIGIDPKDIAGHSLRAGFVTSAAAHRARLDKIMEVTRHRNPSTVMEYIRDTDVFSDHAGEKFL